MGYWDGTDQFLSSHGGHGPACPRCGKEMFPQDDHGRFTCLCNLGGSFDAITGTSTRVSKIQQVDASGMSDKKKARIPAINRLASAPTAAEAEVLRLAAQGPGCMDDPKYWAAVKALEEERGK